MRELEDLGFVEYVPPSTSGVYALCQLDTDVAGWQIVYIGQSGDVPKRLRSHKTRRRPDWDKAFVIWCGVDDLLRIEGEMLRRFRPKYNSHIPQVGYQDVPPTFDLLGALGLEPVEEESPTPVDRRG